MSIDQVSNELIDRCRRDAPGAFDELFSLIQQDLYRWVYSLVRNPDDADEVFQECCIRIYRHLGHLNEYQKFPAWVSRIVANQSSTHRTRMGRMPTVSLEEGVETPNESLVAHSSPRPDPRQALYSQEVLEEVNRAITQLPPRQRTAVLMFDVNSKSIKEIAEAMKCSEGAVKFNIHQGRRKLRDLLSHHLNGSGEHTVIE